MAQQKEDLLKEAPIEDRGRLMFARWQTEEYDLIEPKEASQRSGAHLLVEGYWGSWL